MNRTHNIKRSLVAMAAAATAALAAPAIAGAGTVSIGSDTVLHYIGGANEANHVTLSFDWWHGLYVVQDTAAAIPTPASTSHCTSYDAHTVYCPFGSFGSVNVQLGGGGSYADDELGLTTVTITGGAGNDTMIGGGGNTTLVASGGNDTLTAGSGDTHFVGGSGTATMTGGHGHDSFQGGSGSETINSRDGIAEQVSCGAGVDSVTADPSDTVAADCENVDRGVAAPSGSPSTGTGSSGAPVTPLPGNLPGAPAGFRLPTASVAVPAAPLGVDSAGIVQVPVSCPANAAGGCEGTVALTLATGSAKRRIVAARRERSRVLGKSRKFKLAAGQKTVVPVQLSRRGARILKARKGHARKVLKLTATVATRTEAGVRTSSHVITVTAARRRPTPVHRPKQRQGS